MTRTQAIRTAQEMYEGGWSVAEIQRYLKGHGQSASWQTVKRWVDPEYAEHRRQLWQEASRRRWRREREKQNRYLPVAFRKLDREAKATRIRQLREAQIPVSTIVKIMRLDFNEPLQSDHVKTVLSGGEYPRRFNQPRDRQEVSTA